MVSIDGCKDGEYGPDVRHFGNTMLRARTLPDSPRIRQRDGSERSVQSLRPVSRSSSM